MHLISAGKYACLPFLSDFRQIAISFRNVVTWLCKKNFAKFRSSFLDGKWFIIWRSRFSNHPITAAQPLKPTRYRLLNVLHCAHHAPPTRSIAGLAGFFTLIQPFDWPER